MKILVCSDAHTDARCCGVERFDEVKEAFEDVVSHAVAMNHAGRQTFVAFTGDLCDGDDARDVLRASSLAIETGRDLEHDDISQLWIMGNHDPLGDGSTTLDPLACALGEDDVARGPIHRELCEAGEYYPVLALPYSSSPYDAEEVLATFLRETVKAAHRFVFSHLMLPGMHPGSESAEMARGRDRMFPVELLKGAQRCTVVNGHYHRAGFGPEGIFIPGAMTRNTFGEEKNEPGFLVLDVDRGRVTFEWPPFLSARRMVTIGAGTQRGPFDHVRGAFVRIDPEGMDAEQLPSLVEKVRAHEPLAVKVLAVRRDDVVTAKSERSDLDSEQRRSTREVVLGMTEEATTRDRPALRGFVESVLDDAGL